MSDNETVEKNVINYTPIFPILVCNIHLDLPVIAMSKHILDAASDIKNYFGCWSSLLSPNGIDGIDGVKELKQVIYGVSCSLGRELKYELEYEKSNLIVWAVAMSCDSFQPLRHSPRTTFSGVFFSHVESNKSSLVLKNPTTIFRNHEPIISPQDTTPFNASGFNIKPEENVLYIWPSWMEYEVPQIQTDERLVAFHFSIDFLPSGA